MKSRTRLVSLLVAFALLLVLAPAVLADCTVFMVGKDASVDGSTMITVQQDTRSYPFELIRVPAQDWTPGTIKKVVSWPQFNRYFNEKGAPIDAEHVYTGVEIPEVPHTYSYIKSLFGVMNEHQVSMAMSTIYPDNAFLNNDGKLLMTTLSFIGLERAKTAREAIKVITELAEKYGFASEYSAGKNLVIADPNEIWQLHMWQVGPWDPDAGVSGAVWVAARVPDDHVACFPNGFGIYEIDLSKPDYFMASANLFSLAEEMGRWDTKTQGTGPILNVADVYAPALESWSTLCRKYRGYQLLDPNLKLPTPDEALNLKRPGGKPYRYPFSIKAPRKFSVADLNDYVRDTLEGTPYDVSRGPLAGPFGTWHRTQGSSFDVDGDKKNGPEVRNYNTIANDSSQFTEVCQMRGWLPNPIGGIIWWAPGQPFGALRVPFYAGVTRISEDYGHEVNQHFPKEVFQWGKGAGWAAVFTNTFADILYNYTRDDVKKFQSKVEGEARSLIPAIDKTALALYETDPAKAQEFLTQWCNQFAESATKQHWDFNSYLVWKYHNRAIWEPEQSMNPKMNDEAWWLEQAVEWQQEMEKRK